jgi:hypothetical protein
MTHAIGFTIIQTGMTMKVNFLVIAALLICCTAQAQSLGDLQKKAMSGMDDMSEVASGSLTAALQSQLGITEDQAKGGIGSMLGLANEKLTTGEYDKLAGMIPGADKYLQSAKDLGALSQPLKNLDGLMSALDSLGIPAESVAKFAPLVSDYLGKLGGEDAKAILAKVLS